MPGSRDRRLYRGDRRILNGSVPFRILFWISRASCCLIILSSILVVTDLLAYYTNGTGETFSFEDLVPIPLYLAAILLLIIKPKISNEKLYISLPRIYRVQEQNVVLRYLFVLEAEQAELAKQAK